MGLELWFGPLSRFNSFIEWNKKYGLRLEVNTSLALGVLRVLSFSTQPPSTNS